MKPLYLVVGFLIINYFLKNKKQIEKSVICSKVTDGFEPTIRELQSHALPLG